MATITFHCQSCQQTLRVAGENAGKRTKCTRCGTILTIPAVASQRPAAVPPPPPAPPPRRRDDFDDYDDEVIETRPNYGPAQVGLLITMIGALIVVGALALETIAELLMTLLLMSSGPSLGLAQTVGIVAKISICIFLLGWIVLLVGSGFAMVIRNKNGAMIFGILVLSIGIVGLVLYIVFIFLPTMTSRLMLVDFISWFLRFFAKLLVCTTWLFLALYLRAAARSAGSKKLGNWKLFVMTCILVGIYFLIPLVVYLIMTSTASRGSFGLAITVQILDIALLGFHVVVALLLALRCRAVKAALAKVK